MKRNLLAITLFAFTILITTSSFAQCNLLFSSVGSSAQFNTFAYAATLDRGAVHFFSVKGGSSPVLAAVLDPRPTNPNVDGGAIWIGWDNSATPNVWFDLNVDSVVGNRALFAVNAAGTGQADTLSLDSSLNGGGGTGGTHNQVPGITDTDLTLPSNIFSCVNGSNFNTALSDIRPEDALFATHRALASYNATTLAGLGYNAASCNGTSNVGCSIESSFGSGKANPLEYALFGQTDPITGQKLSTAKFTTLPLGIAPVVVIVSNADTATTTLPQNPAITVPLGYGAQIGGAYAYTNVVLANLSLTFRGIKPLTTGWDATFASCAQPGCPIGHPIQVVQREPISGTYNTFEFTGIRTAANDNTSSSQEFGNDPGVNNYINNTTNCTLGALVSPCNDPLFVSTVTGISGVTGLRLRAIGTGEEVKAVVGAAGGPATPDGIGYAFWSYANLAPAVITGSHPGHYVTVDGVDPLFTTPGGAATVAGASAIENNSGAYNIPACNTSALPCTQNIPFTNIKNGSYPLWSLLRVVTSSGPCTGGKVPPFCEPVEVPLIVAAAQKEAAKNSKNLSEFVPYFDQNGNAETFVFRSHFAPMGVTGGALLTNGHKTCTSFYPPTPAATCLVDGGGDVGGSILTVQEDLDNFVVFGKELLSIHQ